MVNTRISRINNKKIVKIGRFTFFVSGWLQLAIFFLIIAGGILFFLSIYNLLTADQQKWYVALSLAYFIPPAGKETVIFVGLSQGLPVLYWCVTLLVFDILVCLAIMTNWWFLEALIRHIPSFPFIGVRRKKPYVYKTVVSLEHWYEKLHRKTREIELKNYGKLLLIMLTIFMFVPFQGTGAMSTTIIGTFLGLRKHTTFLVVVVGSILSILVLTFISIGIIRL